MDTKRRVSTNIEDRRPGAYDPRQLYRVGPDLHQMRFENAILEKQIELAKQVAAKESLTPLGMYQLFSRSIYEPPQGGIRDDEVKPYFLDPLDISMTNHYQKTKDTEPVLSGKALNRPLRWRLNRVFDP